MREIVVRSWSELNEALFEAAWNPAIGRFRSHRAFRGVPDAAAPLQTGLGHLGGPAALLERNLLRNFQKYAHRGAAPGDSPWSWLALAQHHGLPTRLLDWTFSPLVALHFVTASPEHLGRDGVVWTVDYVQAHRLLPSALREVLERERCDVLPVEALGEAAPDLGALDRLSDEPFALFSEPPSLDERIVNQAALFSVLSSPDLSPAVWVAAHPDLATRLILPAGFKAEVRDKLDALHVTERVLFPGLDGLCRWLTRYYAPAPAALAGAA